ncbi:MAG: response regulator [Nibricoccus sp.]
MKKHRILIVEDEPRMRANLSMILKMEGYDVIEASHGVHGVAAAREHRPDFISAISRCRSSMATVC